MFCHVYREYGSLSKNTMRRSELNDLHVQWPRTLHENPSVSPRAGGRVAAGGPSIPPATTSTIPHTLSTCTSRYNAKDDF